MRSAQRKAHSEAKRAARKADQDFRREVKKVERTANQQLQREVAKENRRIRADNRKSERHNQKVIDQINARLRAAETGAVGYTESELGLADRVQQAVVLDDGREWDAFLGYARDDGSETGEELRGCLDDLEVSVWFDALAIRPGVSQSRQMDEGLRKASAGIVLLTPAYIKGRFWTERELGVLLGKPTCIPVLDGVTFEEVEEFSGILPDLAGFETARDSVEVIAEKIAAAILGGTD